MNGKKMSDILSDVDLKYVTESNPDTFHKKTSIVKWIVPLAAALILIAGLSVGFITAKNHKKYP